MPPLSYTWSVLAEREAARVSLSQMPQPTPKAAFYSVQNALNHPRRNRYSNIMAYDRTAVEADGEYLNANVVCDRYGSWWVASQAPLPGTIYLFLRAMFTRAASTHTTLQVKPPRLPSAKRCILVQLTGIQEGGIKKADPYLPFGSNDKATFPSEHSATQMTLQTTSSTTLPDSGSVITMLDLTSSDDPSDIMQVHHYFFADWPDHGVPQGPAVEKLRALVRDIGRRRAEYECEVWVHCSAGVGRTGTFIALSSLSLPPPGPEISLPLSPLGPLPSDFDSDPVAQCVDSLRESRIMMCQTREQVGLLYSETAEQRQDSPIG